MQYYNEVKMDHFQDRREYSEKTEFEMNKEGRASARQRLIDRIY